MLSHFLRTIGGASAPPATNPPFNLVSLLLHGDGTNGAQNNTFVDSSSNNFTITRTGNVAQGTFSPFSLAEGQWSNYFDGSGDYLSAPSSTAFELAATDDFTIECWVNFNTTGTSLGGFYQSTTNISAATGPIWFGHYNNTLRCARHGSSTYDVNYSWSPTPGTWYHVAATRSSGTTRLFLNGALVQTSTVQNNLAFTQSGAAVGAITTPVYLNGYLSNVRVVKGTAVYTSNFTPPTSALTAISGTSLLTCQSNRFVDNSSNNFTITRNGDTKVTAFSPFAPSAAYDASTNGGSAYFDGSGDSLSAASSTAFALGSGDFTVELFVYYQTMNSGKTLLDFRSGSFSDAKFSLFQAASNGLLYLATAITSRIASDSGVSGANWHHIAFIRASGVVKMFIDGVAQTQTWSNTTDYSTATPFVLGADYNGANALDGYISNLRIVKGTALYTSNFTPPTAPLTAVTNTQLLLNCTNAGIIDNSGKNDIETVGNAQISTSVKKYGTGSMYFDGTGDRLYRSDPTPSFGFGTGDYTVEFWLYVVSMPASKYTLIDFRTASNAQPHTIYVTSTGYLGFYNGSSDVTSSSQPIGSGSWYHIAYSRGSGTLKIFVNGTQAYSAANTIDYQATRPLTVGAAVGGYTGEDLYGYIDDLRITKGQALYTSNFTPPTQAFPNV